MSFTAFCIHDLSGQDNITLNLGAGYLVVNCFEDGNRCQVVLGRDSTLGIIEYLDKIKELLHE